MLTKFNQPLSAGVLPAGLRRLHVGDTWNHPLTPGALPPQLEQLTHRYAFNHPLGPRRHSFPPSRTCAGSIPHGVLHLQIPDCYNHTLPPDVLHTSLRELAFSQSFAHPLQSGSLPDGLQVVAFHERSAFQHALLPGVIPASVSVLSLGRVYVQNLLAGAIPATVKRLRLPAHLAAQDLSKSVSPNTDEV